MEVDIKPERVGYRKSWIPIDFITPTDDASDQAVLDDLNFNQVLDKIGGLKLTMKYRKLGKSGIKVNVHFY